MKLSTLTNKYPTELGAAAGYLENLQGARTCQLATDLTLAALGTRIPGLHGQGADWLAAGRHLAEVEIRGMLDASLITPTAAGKARQMLAGLHTPDGLLSYCCQLSKRFVALVDERAYKLLCRRLAAQQAHPAVFPASQLDQAA